MSEGTATQRRPGRPRSQEADAAILRAAVDLLVERGAGEASIEQIAQRAGVTRATVYRRFRDKTQLLVQAVEAENGAQSESALTWPNVDRMLDDWAGYLGHSRHRRILRRLYGALDDFPELLAAYHESYGRRRAEGVRDTLHRAREAGHLPADVDIDFLQQLLSGAVLHHLGAYPDTTGADEIREYLATALRQVGYRPAPPGP
ncbi:TetR/AcrR family transcriptional regulator [Streptoalloteichus hindustanus]|uniref:Transcriptional regulator, TetR family n=1 Tax=Streptoalloteichus hindustanus TaxID=2017 RepID=A0A1M4ZDD7_STRHI|nr:TetR/AcrR family transcriptional regulator [Streptoalloteichus hindustanus]SHF16069.1 transcriptional regulator, TetR family [Streptoalloteichus hindustanus]